MVTRLKWARIDFEKVTGKKITLWIQIQTAKN